MKALFAPFADEFYRRDVQGIRAIGAALIVVYHIWIGKVSGGVDVFFVVSGFLMTSLLLRQYAREGRMRPFLFWGNIARRISPSAGLVLFVTLILGYFFLPPQFWRVALNDLFFSAVHLENIQLLRFSVDYLARDDPASPFQQFWALSMQVQFYLLLPIILGVGLLLARRFASLAALQLLLAFLVLLSFAYSLFAVAHYPDPAYFDTAARLWEFLAGGFLALILPALPAGRKQSTICGALGLALLLGTGVVLPREVNFPGLASLVPVSGALLLIVAGARGAEASFVTKFLGRRELVSLGTFSFTLYLWHWPLFVYAQYYFESAQLDLAQGALVIIASLGLSGLTTRIVEQPLRLIPKARVWTSYVLATLFLLPVVMPALAARHYAISLADSFEQTLRMDLQAFTGRQISLQDDVETIGLDQFAAVSANKAAPIKYCLTGEICEFGDSSAERIVAIVGGSHAAQWESAFSILGQRYGFKVVTLVQMSCALGWLPGMDEDCRRFNEEIVDRLVALQPDLVITNSTRLDREGTREPSEFVPPSYVAKWRAITAAGIPVIGIRDNPWFHEDPNICLWRKPSAVQDCARPVEDLYLAEDPAQAIEQELPLFQSVDFTPLFCAEGFCPVVFDGRLMYFDTHHFSRAYVEYISTAIDALLREQATVFFDGEPRPDEQPAYSHATELQRFLQGDLQGNLQGNLQGRPLPLEQSRD